MPLWPLMETKVTDLKEDQLITNVLTCIQPNLKLRQTFSLNYFET